MIARYRSSTLTVLIAWRIVTPSPHGRHIVCVYMDVPSYSSERPPTLSSTTLRSWVVVATPSLLRRRLRFPAVCEFVYVMSNLRMLKKVLNSRNNNYKQQKLEKRSPSQGTREGRELQCYVGEEEHG